MSDFKMIAKTFKGLEDVLANELRTLGAKDVESNIRNVSFVGDTGFMYKANYSLRTALRILKPIFEFRARDIAQFYKEIYAFDWTQYIDANSTFTIDSVVNSPIFKHSHYVALKAKDAIVDKIRDEQGDRPNIDRDCPDLKVHIHINREKVSVSLDSSGEPLFKRGYRKHTQEAPINEVLAAGLLKLAHWEGKANFVDPMCGSGTFLIEAVMMAMNIPVQHLREEFQFMKWKDYDAELFEIIKEGLSKRIKESHVSYHGSDNSPKALHDAKDNLENALLDDYIELSKISFFKSEKPKGPTFVMFNPPYGERLKIPIDDFYLKIGDTLKQKYAGAEAWFITSDLEGIKSVGLKATKKIPIQNGALDCRFVRYDLYEGSKRKPKEI